MARYLWIIPLMIIVILLGWSTGTRVGTPVSVVVTNNPSEARIKSLEARINLLEQWAIKHGGKL